MSLWRRSLVDLRGRFSDGASMHPSLRLAMVQVAEVGKRKSIDALERTLRGELRAQGLEDEPEFPFPEFQNTSPFENILKMALRLQEPGNQVLSDVPYALWRVQQGKYERTRDGEHHKQEIVDRSIFYVPAFSGGDEGDKQETVGPFIFFACAFSGSDEKELKEFELVACDAGHVLTSSCPPEFKHVMPTEFWQLYRFDIDRFPLCHWITVLFHLAWSQPKGSTLRATRYLPDARLGPDEIGRDTVFLSILPINPFQASVAAIDVILGKTHRTSRGKGATQEKAESDLGNEQTSNGRSLTPKAYLFGWPEILKTLEERNDDEVRRQVSRMNKDFNGPIIIEKQGSKPKVEKQKLIEWWNGLEVQWADRMHQEEGKKLSAEIQHNFGKDGEAAPEIGGGVKKRRADRKS